MLLRETLLSNLQNFLNIFSHNSSYRQLIFAPILESLTREEFISLNLSISFETVKHWECDIDYFQTHIRLPDLTRNVLTPTRITEIQNFWLDTCVCKSGFYHMLTKPGTKEKILKQFQLDTTLHI